VSITTLIAFQRKIQTWKELLFEFFLQIEMNTIVRRILINPRLRITQNVVPKQFITRLYTGNMSNRKVAVVVGAGPGTSD